MATNRGGVNVPISATWNGRALKQAESQLGSFKKSFGKAFMGIGAAAGAAVGVGALVDQMQQMALAAAEDQKSVVSLAKAMQNVGLGAATAQTEAFTKSLMLATGQSDELIRNGLQTLITATGDLEKAQSGVTLAMDISAATGRSLAEVTKALARGYSGSAVGLSRLGVGLDKALLASGDMATITAELERKFGGQAAAAAETYAGKLLRVQQAAGEAQETVGYELLRALDNVGSALGGTGGFVDMITAAGDALAGFVSGLGVAATETTNFGKAIVSAVPGVDAAETSFTDMLITTGKLIPGLGLVVTTTEGLVKVGQEEMRVQQELADELARSAMLRDIYSGKVDASARALDSDTDATKRNVTVKERLIRAEERLNGFNRSIIGANLRLAQMRDDGVDPMSDGKKGVSARDRRSFGLDYASAVNDKYELLVGEGKLKKASAVLEQGRSYLAGQVSQKFADRVLATPKALTNEIDRRDSVRGANQWQATMSSVFSGNVTINVTAETPAQATQQAKQWARLAAAGRGPAAMPSQRTTAPNPRGSALGLNPATGGAR